MPLYDHECTDCERIFEGFARIDETSVPCVCGGMARRIISVSGQYTGNQDSVWLKSVVDVCDKESRKPHVRAFIENPTRANYKAFLKGERLKPVDYTEHGGPPAYKKPDPPDMTKAHREVWEEHRKRRAIEVRTS